MAELNFSFDMMANIGLFHYLILSSLLLTIAIIGFLINRKNIINILISIELMLLSVNINFVAFSVYMNDNMGKIFTIFILSIAAAEIAIGLAILVLYYKNTTNIAISKANRLKDPIDQV